MAKDLTPKAKRHRRLGTRPESNVEGVSSTAKAVSKRSYPPGIHGPKGQQRLTDYAEHLNEKQKLRLMYNIMERQLKKYFKEAVKVEGNTGSKLIEFLERRLDNVIYRLGLAMTRAQARQLISHNHFQVNGKKMNIPSYRVSAGDVINVKKEKMTGSGVIADAIKITAKKEPPQWLIWDEKDKKGQVSGMPQGTDLQVGIDNRLIVEYYSK